MLGWLFRRKPRPPKQTQKSRHVRLCIEELEPRNLPSSFGLGLDEIVALPNDQATPLAGSSFSAVYTPNQIRHAYGFDQITFGNGSIKGDGSGQTIAIVNAYDDPRIASDLAFFDRTFGLSDPVSFRKVNQYGGATLPRVDSGWAMETALDVEWAHAIAPGANILLVEANSNSLNDLLTAVDFARKQTGVVSVSMSWGAGEFSRETLYDSFFTTPTGHIGGSGLAGGVTFVAASGDNGAWYGTGWPAISPNVLSVGGTTLQLDSRGNYAGETGWSGSGGGFSLFEREPSYQLSVQNSGVRTNPDVAYNADPRTGVYVYDTVPYGGYSGWYSVGGTSAGSPQWAALIAIADQGRAVNGKGSLGNAQAALYSLSSSVFHDITRGSNGYSARTGYDLVTGRGSPIANQVVQALMGFTTASTATSSTSTSATGIKSLSKLSFVGPDSAAPFLPLPGAAWATGFTGAYGSKGNTHDGDTLAKIDQSAWSSAATLPFAAKANTVEIRAVLTAPALAPSQESLDAPNNDNSARASERAPASPDTILIEAPVSPDGNGISDDFLIPGPTAPAPVANPAIFSGGVAYLKGTPVDSPGVAYLKGTPLTVEEENLVRCLTLAAVVKAEAAWKKEDEIRNGKR